MKPLNFDAANIMFAENQPQYETLPARVCLIDEDGEVTTCWSLSWKERLKLLFTGRLWLSVLTFNNPLQPQRPSVECPFED